MATAGMTIKVHSTSLQAWTIEIKKDLHYFLLAFLTL